MSCQGSNSHIIELNIDPSKHALDEKYQDTLVKFCGLATKEFGNVHITNHRAVGSKGPPKGYGVEWLEREPTLPNQNNAVSRVMFVRFADGKTLGTRI